MSSFFPTTSFARLKDGDGGSLESSRRFADGRKLNAGHPPSKSCCLFTSFCAVARQKIFVFKQLGQSRLPHPS